MGSIASSLKKHYLNFVFCLFFYCSVRFLFDHIYFYCYFNYFWFNGFKFLGLTVLKFRFTFLRKPKLLIYKSKRLLYTYALKISSLIINKGKMMQQ